MYIFHNKPRLVIPTYFSVEDMIGILYFVQPICLYHVVLYNTKKYNGGITYTCKPVYFITHIKYI